MLTSIFIPAGIQAEQRIRQVPIQKSLEKMVIFSFASEEMGTVQVVALSMWAEALFLNDN